MIDDDLSDARPARHVTSVQAWRAPVPDPSGDGEDTDSLVLELGVDEGELPPLIVPVAALPGLLAVLLDAAGLTEPVGAIGAVPVVVDRDASTTDDAAPSTDAFVAGPAWSPLAGTRREVAVALDRSSVPASSGVYAWFLDGRPIHLGRAVGKRGLRARIGGDALRGDADLSRSTFRAAVAEHLGFGLDPGGGPARLDPDEVDRLDAWIDATEVAWLPTSSPAAAADLEAALRAELDPHP